MADIINLNKARKAKARTEAKKQAADNRVLFGTSTKLRQAQKAKEELAKQRLEGHRLESDASPQTPDKPKS